MNGKPRSTDRVRDAAETAGLAIAIREMPQSTRTAEEAAAACGTSVGQIVKSLIFRGAQTGEPLLLLVSGANRVDTKAVAGTIGEALERMDADAVRAATGFAIGGVAPLGATAPLRTFIDEDLLAYETVWAAAGSPQAVFEAEPAALAKAANATTIKVR
jgi:prolyl-tRNA editing enzyme YbaK/EbsC (Cys-tRNA(Pro) deacylase)